MNQLKPAIIDGNLMTLFSIIKKNKNICINLNNTIKLEYSMSIQVFSKSSICILSGLVGPISRTRSSGFSQV